MLKCNDEYLSTCAWGLCYFVNETHRVAWHKHESSGLRWVDWGLFWGKEFCGDFSLVKDFHPRKSTKIPYPKKMSLDHIQPQTRASHIQVPIYPSYSPWVFTYLILNYNYDWLTTHVCILLWKRSRLSKYDLSSLSLVFCFSSFSTVHTSHLANRFT